MARTIDRVIEYIREMGGMSPVEKRVAIDRLQSPPSPAEIERARLAIAADQREADRDG